MNQAYQPTQTLKMWVAVLPMFTSFISFLASMTIIGMILRSSKRLSNTYRRLVFGMSCIDIVYDIGYMFSTFPSPRGTTHVWKAFGTTSTCTLQGFLIFTGCVGGGLYNFVLSLFYLFTIEYGVKSEVMTKRIEPFLHGVPSIYLFGANIFLLYHESFNTAGTICMIAPNPRNCHKDPNVQCERGENASMYFWYFHGLPLLVLFVLIGYCMRRVYYQVQVVDNKMESYRTFRSTLPDNLQSMREERRRSQASSTLALSHMSGKYTNNDDGSRRYFKLPSNLSFRLWKRSSEQPRRRQNAFTKSRHDAMIQCALYITTLFSAQFFAGLLNVLFVITGEMNVPVWILCQLFSPLQGFFNLLVFLRPRLNSMRVTYPELTLKAAIHKAITTKDWDVTEERRRNSLIQTQRNGGRRYTAREFHMREAAQGVARELQIEN